MRMHSKSTQRKLASHKKTSRGNVSGRSLVTMAKKYNLEQFVLVPASGYNKSLTTMSVTNHELPKYKAEQPPKYHIDFLKRDINKKLFGKADTLIDKIFSCSRITFSNSQTIILDGVNTGVLTSDFTLHWSRKNADVPDIYFTLLGAAGISPSLVFKQNAKAKVRGSWFLQSMNVRNCKDCISKVLLLTVLYAAWQKLTDYQYLRWYSVYIQRLFIQNLLWQHKNSREWGLLLDSEMKFGAWISLTLINWQKRRTV